MVRLLMRAGTPGVCASTLSLHSKAYGAHGTYMGHMEDAQCAMHGAQACVPAVCRPSVCLMGWLCPVATLACGGVWVCDCQVCAAGIYRGWSVWRR